MSKKVLPLLVFALICFALPSFGQKQAQPKAKAAPTPALNMSESNQLIETPVFVEQAIVAEMEYTSFEELRASKPNYTVADLEALRASLKESSALTEKESRIIEKAIADRNKLKTKQD